MDLLTVVGPLPPGPQYLSSKHLYTEIRWISPETGVMQRRSVRYKRAMFDHDDESAWLDAMTQHSIFTHGLYKIILSEVELTTELAHVLTMTGRTRIGIKDFFVEIRAVSRLEFSDRSYKLMATIVPRVVLMYGHQTWLYAERQYQWPQLVHQLFLRPLRTRMSIEGKQLIGAPSEGALWYKDLTEWRAPKAKIYDAIEVKEGRAHEVSYHAVANTNAIHESAGRGY